MVETHSLPFGSLFGHDMPVLKIFSSAADRGSLKCRCFTASNYELPCQQVNPLGYP